MLPEPTEEQIDRIARRLGKEITTPGYYSNSQIPGVTDRYPIEPEVLDQPLNGTTLLYLMMFARAQDIGDGGIATIHPSPWLRQTIELSNPTFFECLSARREHGSSPELDEQAYLAYLTKVVAAAEVAAIQIDLQHGERLSE